MLIAIGATFAYLLHKMMHPRDALLGRIPGRDGFYKLHRRADARPVPGLTIALIEGDLLFFNADHVQARLLAIADADAARTPAGSCSTPAPSPRSTSTAAAMLEEVRADLADARHRASASPSCTPRSASLLDRAGLLAAVGPDMIFDDLDDALRAFEASGANTGGNA